MEHIPVLLREVVRYLNPQPGQKFIDATINGGGHAEAVAERILPNGTLLGIDLDNNLIEKLKFKIQNSKFKNNIILTADSYINLKEIARKNNFLGADGILFDLGMSSWHLEESGRGFSFARNEPLDMRYYGRQKLRVPSSKLRKNITAAEIVNRYSYDRLVEILKEYGEEKFAKSIAAGITKKRKEKPIRTTLELVEVVKNSVPPWYRSERRRLHFATKTFQALRIAVNDELKNIESGLRQAEEVLKKGGRLAVISFHSLEDRIVKNFFRDKKNEKKFEILTKKPVRAEIKELAANPRARSAKLRVAEKIASSF